MKVNIQTYDQKYQKEIEELILDIQQKEFDIPINLEQQPDLLKISEVYQQNNGNFWIALDEDRVVGTIGLIDIGMRQVALRKMFVHKDYRGGLIKTAALLLETAFNWAKIRSISEIYLGTTDKFLAAHRFYEKHGFVEILQAQLPKSFPIIPVDRKFYLYQL